MSGETPCIEYSGTVNVDGYGVLPQPVNGSRLAHRAALAEKLGRPVQGSTLHSCDNPPCVNPDHLIEGTQAENVRDARSKGRCRGKYSGATHCKWGHEFSPENTRMKYYADGRTERVCLACRGRRNTQSAERRKVRRANRKAVNA